MRTLFTLSQENKLRLTGVILIFAVFGNSYDIKLRPAVLGTQTQRLAQVQTPANTPPISWATADLPTQEPPHYIAHEGGLYEGHTYTNTIAALEHSYSLGFRLQEVDLNLTTDNQIVLLHDWEKTVENVYGISPGERDLETLRTDAAASPFRPADLPDLVAYMQTHPDTRIMLDTKVATVDILTRIANRYPNLRNQFLPLITDFAQYDQVAKLGYRDITLLLGNPAPFTPTEVLSFARSHRLFAVSVPPPTFEAQLPELSQYARVYCWTIDDAPTAQNLARQNVYGIVTNVLFQPPDHPWGGSL
jgi:lipoteichoic acid synthase